MRVNSRGTWSKRQTRENSKATTTAPPLSPPFSLNDDDSGNYYNNSSADSKDLDIPIAIRKDVRSCT